MPTILDKKAGVKLSGNINLTAGTMSRLAYLDSRWSWSWRVSNEYRRGYEIFMEENRNDELDEQVDEYIRLLDS